MIIMRLYLKSWMPFLGPFSRFQLKISVAQIETNLRFTANKAHFLNNHNILPLKNALYHNNTTVPKSYRKSLERDAISIHLAHISMCTWLFVFSGLVGVKHHKSNQIKSNHHLLAIVLSFIWQDWNCILLTCVKHLWWRNHLSKRGCHIKLLFLSLKGQSSIWIKHIF
jgi:hypothetical protein